VTHGGELPPSRGEMEKLLCHVGDTGRTVLMVGRSENREGEDSTVSRRRGLGSSGDELP
jgi:hypothetical protein